MSKEILEKMQKMCEENGYEPTEFMEKIANAKLRLFGHEEWMRCPCDAKNEKRACISDQCKKDIEETGRCHCNCYAKKGHGKSKLADQ